MFGVICFRSGFLYNPVVRAAWQIGRRGAAGIAGALLCGCGAAAPTVSLRLQPAGTQLVEPFTQAYTGHDPTGDDRVVLVRDPLDDTRAGAPGAALSPVAVPLRQVLTVRLLYRPMPGARGDSPAAANAAIHWYVLGNPEAGVAGLLHYEGTGFVSITPEHGSDAVVIQNATLTLVQQQGELVDPLHAFTLNAKFSAEQNEPAVAAALEEVQTAEHPPATPAPATAPSISDLPTTFPTTMP